MAFVLIAKARAGDLPFIETTSVACFQSLGDYGRLLREWMVSPGVHTYVARDEQQRAGFVMVGFYWLTPGSKVAFADVLAIAVDDGFRGRGVGRLLLRHAVDVAQQTRSAIDVTEVRLSVAEENHTALALFTSEGFREGAESRGRYDGGQVALRLVLPLR